MGDFIEVLSSDDRGSHISSLSSMEDFKSFIQTLQLIEISPDGRFTWFRGNSKSKLDRIFVSPKLIPIYPNLRVSLLKRGLSNHCPLLLHSHDRNRGPKPFKFMNCWLTNPQYMRIIKASWENSPSLSLNGKLKNIQKNMRTWNKNVFGNIDSNISNLEALYKDLMRSQTSET